MNSTAIVSALPVWLWLLLLLRPQPGSGQLLDAACGIRADSSRGPSYRVLHGTKDGLTSSPWVVSLYSTDDRFVCLGTLITRRLVLTAAHCLLLDLKKIVVWLGECQRCQEDKCHNTAASPHCTMREEHYVDAVFRHGLYDRATYSNDIAILRMSVPVTYKDNIRPICILLNPRFRSYFDNLNVLTGTGWGRTQDDPDSDYLMSLNIYRQDPGVCPMYMSSPPLASNQFCAGNLDSNMCNGDSGAPVGALVPIRNQTRFVQVGIASYSNRQCTYARVFTNVLSHADWIRTVARKYGNGQPTKKTKSSTDTASSGGIQQS